ncbi:MAG: cation:proton antiporter [Deltaproteobacteria bacterium]
MHSNALVLISAILLTGIACQWVAWRVKLPAILFLLFSGIIAGPVLGWLQPDRLFGNFLFPFISLAVAVILFEGSLTLKFHEVFGLEKVIRNMITFGAGVTWIITALAARLLLHFSWEVSFLFGALMVVTGPTVIVPMLRTVRPKEAVSHILRWEGILIDPIGATLAILVFEFIVAGGKSSGFSAGLLAFAKITVIGIVLGAAGGYLFGYILRRNWIPRYLQNYAALALACSVFTLSDILEAESGLLTVTVMGIWMANMKGIDLDELLDFKESLSVLLISMLFIILAARMDMAAFLNLGWPALGVFGVIQFLARPLNVQVSAIGSKLSMAERHLLAWIAPRGIVAAAISSLFALKLDAAGFSQASQMVPLTFMIIIGTVLLQSATARPIAKVLNVAEPEPRGFLIIGADAVARGIAEALQHNNYNVLLADQNWENIMQAKMKGFATYWGNPASEHAERHLSLIGIGRLLALSSNRELNALAAQHYRLEFGHNNIYRIRTRRQDNQPPENKVVSKWSGRHLFGETTTHDALAKILVSGGELNTTPLTDKFSFKNYLEQRRPQRIPLFAVDPDGCIHPFTSEAAIVPKAGWRVIGISFEAAKSPPAKD